MDTKLLTLDECRQYPLQSGWFDELIKKVQRNAIEIAVQRCSEDAYCDMIHPGDDDYPELEESDYMVVKHSILDCKQKLFEENNL